jgi:hypothetical protein
MLEIALVLGEDVSGVYAIRGMLVGMMNESFWMAGKSVITVY